MIRPAKFLVLVLKPALAAVTALVCVTGALAASPSASADAQTRYRQDMAVCNSGQSNQDRATCRTEATHALAAARRGALRDAPDQYQQNALQRCSVHKDDDRRACEARMMVPNGMAGSSAEGGILRESVTVTPVK
jgi:hypothetical protein